MSSGLSGGPDTACDPRQVRARRRRRRIPWGIYLALVPALGLLGFFGYYPGISGLIHSLTNWEPGFSSPFVGLANYRAMWHDSLWWEAFVHIGIIFAVAVTAMCSFNNYACAQIGRHGGQAAARTGSRS